MAGKLSRRLCCLLIGGFLVAGSPLPAQESVLPFIVVVDVNEDVLGPAVGLVTLNTVAIRMKDPNFGTPFFLEVRDLDLLVGPSSSTYFAQTGCTGTTVYHNPVFAPSNSGIGALTGFAYSVARTGGAQWLIRSDNAASISSNVEIKSTFASFNDSCSDSTFTSDMRVATLVQDLDAAHPPPYALQ